MIQLFNHPSYLGISNQSKVGSLRKILSYQAIGIHDGTPLAGAVGITETDRRRHLLMAWEFRTIVPHDCPHCLAPRCQQSDHGGLGEFRSDARQAGRQEIATAPLDGRDESRLLIHF